MSENEESIVKDEKDDNTVNLRVVSQVICYLLIERMVPKFISELKKKHH